MPERLLQLECSFCHKTQKEVAKLVAGPTVYICNECAGSFLERMKSGGGDESAAKDRCSFCGKARSELTAMFSREDHRICNECLDICEEIMNEAPFSREAPATPNNQ